MIVWLPSSLIPLLATLKTSDGDEQEFEAPGSLGEGAQDIEAPYREGLVM